MAQIEKKEPSNTPYNFKLSDYAKRKGYSEIVDSCLVTVHPEHYEGIIIVDGPTIPGEFKPAKTIITHPNGHKDICENGFKDLSPRQVYELVNAGIIILSSRRKDHRQIIQEYLKANVINIDPEDY